MGKEKEEVKQGKRFKYDFTKTEYNYMCEEAMLNDIQKQILEDKIKGTSIIEMSFKYNVSPETIKRHVKKIKNRIMKVIEKM